MECTRRSNESLFYKQQTNTHTDTHAGQIISSSYRGELSFLQPVHFCICWRDSSVLIGYLFRQWPACVCVPNWKNNVLGVELRRQTPMNYSDSTTFILLHLLHKEQRDCFRMMVMETVQARKTGGGYSSKKKRRAQNGGRGDGDCSSKKKRWRLLKQEKTSRAERGAGVMETAQARNNDGDC